MADEFLLSEISAVRALGGDVMVSFGGAANVEIAVACDTVQETQTAYQTVIDTYDLVMIDFDIEGAWIADPVSIARRSQAIAGLQAQAAGTGRYLEVFYTLPCFPPADSRWNQCAPIRIGSRCNY